MQAPVIMRSAGATTEVGSTTRRSAFAPAPIVAETAKNRRGSSLSASPMSALARQPATKPACTPLVSAALEKLERWNSAASAGSTADAENQSAIAATWQNAMIAIDAAFDSENLVTADLPIPGGAWFATSSDLRQRDAPLPLVLAAAVLV